MAIKTFFEFYKPVLIVAIIMKDRYVNIFLCHYSILYLRHKYNVYHDHLLFFEFFDANGSKGISLRNKSLINIFVSGVYYHI